MGEPAGSGSFKEFERTGWSARAPHYDSFAGKITKGAVTPLLDATGVTPGTRVLDVACGTGLLAAGAAARGAIPIGVDFAATMVAEAWRRFPAIDFREGDAENLAFDAGSFDAVVCGFGLLHVPDPDRAIAEACRVLRSGGRYGFTVWSEAGHEFFALVNDAVRAHANLDVGLPPAPSMFRFSDPEECRVSLRRAGFVDPVVAELPLRWHAPSADAVLEFLKKSAVRLGMILEFQTDEARARVYQAVLVGAERFRRDDGYHIAWPAVLASARKP